MEGDDQQDPLVDAVRALLDGHVVLDREPGGTRTIIRRSRCFDSLSRLMPADYSEEHIQRAKALRPADGSPTRRSEDLIRIGAYQKGTDKDLDKALAMLPRVEDFLRQDSAKMAKLDDNIQQLLALGN